MNQLRIKTIASFITSEDSVLDIGTDHAYLPIYLVQNKICKHVMASDIHKNALDNAKQNIKKNNLENKITTVLADGFKGIDLCNINTLVLAGMGTTTILRILEEVDQKKIKKLVLQSNNDLYILRTSLEKMGYFLNKEKVIYEGKHYYTIGLYTLSFHKLTIREKYFGLYEQENKYYYQELNQKYYSIYQKISWRHIKEKIKLKFQMYLLKKYL